MLSRKMTRVLLFNFVALITIGTTQVNAKDWGAVSADLNWGFFGAATQERSQAAARQSATKRCKVSGGRECRILKTFRGKKCVSLYGAKESNAFKARCRKRGDCQFGHGWQTDTGLRKARLRAKRRCLSFKPRRGCVELIAVCGGPDWNG